VDALGGYLLRRNRIRYDDRVGAALEQDAAICALYQNCQA